MKSAKVRWSAALGLAITAFLLWWVLRDVDLATVWAEIRRANFWLLGLSIAIATGTYLIRALRWKILLKPVQPGTTLRSRFAAVNIGFMANNLLPARAGEFARAYALSRLEPISASSAFGSLVVERFLDSLVLVAYLFLAMAMPGFPSNPSVGGVSLGAVVEATTLALGLFVCVMLLMLLFPGPLVGLAERLARHLPGRLSRLVTDALEAFLDGLKLLRKPWLLFLALLWTMVVWAWQSLAFWVGFKAFGIHVGYDVALFTNTIVAFAVGIPSAPGFFGTFQGGAKLGLGVYGVPVAPTLAFAFGFHLGGFVPVTVIGLYYAWRVGLTLGEVEESEERVEASVEAEHGESGGKVEASVKPEPGAGNPDLPSGGAGAQKSDEHRTGARRLK